MFDRFTDRARKVMSLADQEGHRLNHEYIGTEHLLIGLVKEGSGIACCVLRDLGVDLKKVREEVEKVVRKGPEMVTMGTLPLTPRTKRVIEYAIENAREMGHNTIGTEHLLLGLFDDDSNVAAQIIQNMGITGEQIKAEIMRLLGIDIEDEDPNGENCLLCSKFHYCYVTQSIMEKITRVLVGFVTTADTVALGKDFFKLLAPKCNKYERNSCEK